MASSVDSGGGWFATCVETGSLGAAGVETGSLDLLVARLGNGTSSDEASGGPLSRFRWGTSRVVAPGVAREFGDRDGLAGSTAGEVGFARGLLCWTVSAGRGVVRSVGLGEVPSLDAGDGLGWGLSSSEGG